MMPILVQYSLEFKNKLNYQPENRSIFVKIEKRNLFTLKKIRPNNNDVLTKVIAKFHI